MLEDNMKEITSINNDYIKYLLKLKEKKYRHLEKKFIIEGYHLVNEAYQAKMLKEVLVIDDDEKFEGVSVIKVTDQIIKKLSSTITPQNIIGICDISNEKEIKGKKILLLDNINDPGNLGTLIRSSLGFGIDTIVLSEDCVDLYNEKVVRATQGAIFKINIIINDLKETIAYLQKHDIKVLGTSLESSKFLQEYKVNNNYAILLGNEANGVKKELLQLTNDNTKIEIANKLESLNVAVAFSIVLYNLTH
jgi:TrmH family RNA methyltransferase